METLGRTASAGSSRSKSRIGYTMKSVKRKLLPHELLKPRRASTAYAFFIKNERQKLAQENPGLQSRQILSKLAQIWRDMPNEKKGPYISLAAEDKLRYQNDADEWLYEPPQKPKKAYMLFSAELRNDLIVRNPEASTEQIIALLNSQWDALSDIVKNKYINQEKELKKKYEIDLIKWNEQVKSAGIKKKLAEAIAMGRLPYDKRSKRLSKPLPKLKQPHGAYMCYSIKERPAVQAEHPSWTVVEISRELGRRWKQMTEDEKVPYVELREKNRQRYHREKAKTATSTDLRDDDQDGLGPLFLGFPEAAADLVSALPASSTGHLTNGSTRNDSDIVLPTRQQQNMMQPDQRRLLTHQFQQRLLANQQHYPQPPHTSSLSTNEDYSFWYPYHNQQQQQVQHSQIPYEQLAQMQMWQQQQQQQLQNQMQFQQQIHNLQPQAIQPSVRMRNYRQSAISSQHQLSNSSPRPLRHSIGPLNQSSSDDSDHQFLQQHLIQHDNDAHVPEEHAAPEDENAAQANSPNEGSE